MKKIFTIIAMSVLAVSAFAQTSQQYFRVEFSVPVSNEGKVNSGTNNSVSATMKDEYTYCNPEHEYLVFQATNNPLSFDNTTHNYNENSYFYLKNKRVTQAGETETIYRYMCDKITKISAFSLPVERVVLLDSTKTHRIVKGDFPGDFTPDGYYDVAEFTFNRLPRNVAELKTLLENPDGTPVEARNNPLFMAAVCYLIWPRILECSQDCRDMWDYMYGKQHAALNTHGIANQTFQDACISQFVGKDGAGVYRHYNAYQFFDGAKPGNQYKPNGKGYDGGVDNGPYKVRVGWDPRGNAYDAQKGCDIANMLLFPNPSATTKAEMSFDYPVGHVVQFRSTKKNGWFLYEGEKVYYANGKDMYDDEF